MSRRAHGRYVNKQSASVRATRMRVHDARPKMSVLRLVHVRETRGRPLSRTTRRLYEVRSLGVRCGAGVCAFTLRRSSPKVTSRYGASPRYAIVRFPILYGGGLIFGSWVVIFLQWTIVSSSVRF